MIMILLIQPKALNCLNSLLHRYIYLN